MEMSRPWVSNRQKKTSEKTMKYAPLRWELKQKYPGYEISQYNIIVDILGGWSTDVEVAVKELVGRRHRDVLKKMQRAQGWIQGSLPDFGNSLKFFPT